MEMGFYKIVVTVNYCFKMGVFAMEFTVASGKYFSLKNGTKIY